VTVYIENILFQFLKNFHHRRVRDAHLLRYKGLAVAYYGCILECLSNERLAQVKYPG
jgi:hypothetical protein